MEKNEKDSTHQEFKGRNLEDVISLAEETLKVARSQFNYEIVAEKTKLFGMKSKEIVIRTWPKKPTNEHPVGQFLDDLLSLFPLDISYNLKERNHMTFIIFEGPDRYLLLRKDGSLLLALQHLLNKISSQKVQVDCNFYRKKKERELKEYIQDIAKKVQESGQNEILDLMNPYERRIVHIAANRISGVTTESIGEGFLKKVKIISEKDVS